MATRGLVLDLAWDDDHLWAKPAPFQKVRFAVLGVVFLGLGGLALVVTVLLVAVLRDARLLLGLVFAVVFGGVGFIVRAIGRRMLANFAFAFSRSRGYHDGDQWHPWERVRRVSVPGGVVQRVQVELVDGGGSHLVGQVGYPTQTRDLRELLPSFVPPDRLDLR